MAGGMYDRARDRGVLPETLDAIDQFLHATVIACNQGNYTRNRTIWRCILLHLTRTN